MAHLAIGTTQTPITPDFSFGLTIMIPNRLEFPRMAVEDTVDSSQKQTKKKPKNDHSVRFKDVLCEVFEIPDRKMLRELAAMASPVAMPEVETAITGSKTPSSCSVVGASDFQPFSAGIRMSVSVSNFQTVTADNSADSLVFVSAAALQSFLQRTYSIESRYF